MNVSSDNRRGIACIVVAGMGFGVSDSLTKLGTLSLPLGEVLLIRGLATSILFICILAITRQLPKLAVAKSPKVLGRSFFEMCATIAYILAISHLRIADTTAIVLSSPIFITLFAIVILREKIGWHRWGGIICGITGVILIIKPNPDNVDVWALLAGVAALSSAARDLITRNIDIGASSLAIALAATVAITLSGLALCLGGSWVSPGMPEIAMLMGASICHGLGIYMNVLGFKGPVSVSLISPFRYTNLLWATLVAFFVFGEIPDRYAIVGSILIIGSGIYVLHREMVLKRYVTAEGSLEQHQALKYDRPS